MNPVTILAAMMALLSTVQLATQIGIWWALLIAACSCVLAWFVADLLYKHS